MKILHVIETLEVGGAEMVVVNLVNHMLKDNDLAVCCVKKKGPLIERMLHGIPVYCLNKSEGNDATIPFRLAKIIRQNKFDIVHSHNWGVFLEAVWGGWIGRAKAIIHTAHGDLAHYSSNRIKKKLRQAAEKMSAAVLSEIVTVSKFIRHQISTELSISTNKLSTIYNGIDCSKNQSAYFQKSIKRQAEVVIVSVGRLAEVKNYRMLLNAFALAQDRISTTMQLVIIGDGPERNSLEKYADALQHSGNINFLGFRDDVEQILNSCDIFALSSHYEGISIAILEAMKVGLPVIATSVGGNSETVQHNVTGLLVQANDIEGLSSAIIELATNSQKREHLGRRGMQCVQNKFNLHNTVEMYLNIYNKHLNLT